MTMEAHSLKAVYPELAQEEFEKIHIIARIASVMKYFF